MAVKFHEEIISELNQLKTGIIPYLEKGRERDAEKLFEKFEKFLEAANIDNFYFLRLKNGEIKKFRSAKFLAQELGISHQYALSLIYKGGKVGKLKSNLFSRDLALLNKVAEQIKFKLIDCELYFRDLKGKVRSFDTIDELAKAVNMKPSTIRTYFSNAQKPTIDLKVGTVSKIKLEELTEAEAFERSFVLKNGRVPNHDELPTFTKFRTN